MGTLSISQPIRGGDEACATKKGYTGTCKCFTCLKKKKVLVTSLGMRVWVKEHSLKVSQSSGQSHRIPCFTSQHLTASNSKYDPCLSSRASELHTEVAVAVGVAVGQPPFLKDCICDVHHLYAPESHRSLVSAVYYSTRGRQCCVSTVYPTASMH